MAWSHRQQRATDAVLGGFARDLSGRARQERLKGRPALTPALVGSPRLVREEVMARPAAFGASPSEVVFRFSRKVTRLVAVGATALALAIGGMAIANSGLGGSASGTASAATVKVVSVHHGRTSATKSGTQARPTRV
jgi:hypothetical protein